MHRQIAIDRHIYRKADRETDGKTEREMIVITQSAAKVIYITTDAIIQSK